MKKRTLTLTLPLIGIAATSLAASEHLFNFAFKRVNYVPETSADKQKYADAYYAYVDWYQHVTKEKWYLHEHDPKTEWWPNTSRPQPQPTDGHHLTWLQGQW